MGYPRKTRAVPSTQTRTAVIPIVLNRKHYEQAHEAAHANADLWNQLTKWVRDEWSQGRSPGTKEIENYGDSLKQHPLHSHTIQATAHDVDEAIQTYRTNRAEGRRGRAPWRAKQYRPLSFSRNFGWRVTPEDKLALSFGRRGERIILPVPEVVDSQTGFATDSAQWGEIILCWDQNARQWSLHIPYESDTWSPLTQAVKDADGNYPENTRVYAIDPGIIHPMAVTTIRDNKVEGLVVVGRGIRSSKRLRNKTVGALQSKMSKCKEGSRKWRRYNLAKKRAIAKTDRKLKDYDHKVTATVNKFIRSDAVDTTTGEMFPVRILMGDVRGIEKNTNKRRRLRRSTRQQVSQWSRGRQDGYLSKKTGIILEYVNEAHSTQSCPRCLHRKKQYSRNYKCQISGCNAVLPRDVVGSGNIGSLGINGGTFVPWFDVNTQVHVTYQRATHDWIRDQSSQHSHYDALQGRAGTGVGKHVVGAPDRATRGLSSRVARRRVETQPALQDTLERCGSSIVTGQVST